MKFELEWKGHKLTGRDSYLKPWQRITSFASAIDNELKERFGSTAFLDALQIFNPQAWKENRAQLYGSGIFLTYFLRRNQMRRKEGSIMPQITTGFILRPHARIQIAIVSYIAYLPRS